MGSIMDLMPRLLVGDGGMSMESHSSSWGKPDEVIHKELVVHVRKIPRFMEKLGVKQSRLGLAVPSGF